MAQLNGSSGGQTHLGSLAAQAGTNGQLKKKNASQVTLRQMASTGIP